LWQHRNIFLPDFCYRDFTYKSLCSFFVNRAMFYMLLVSFYRYHGVTHVFVNDPTRGYGIFAENMDSTLLTIAAQAA